MKITSMTGFATALLLALFLVPATAHADSTKTTILIENEAGHELVGEVIRKNTGEIRKMPNRSVTPFIYRATAYFAKDTVYKYLIKIKDQAGHVSKAELLLINAWAIGPEVLRCEIVATETGIPGTTLSATAHQDGLGSCRSVVTIRSE